MAMLRVADSKSRGGYIATHGHVARHEFDQVGACRPIVSSAAGADKVDDHHRICLVAGLGCPIICRLGITM
jgi:hypothetical protein